MWLPALVTGTVIVGTVIADGLCPSARASTASDRYNLGLQYLKHNNRAAALKEFNAAIAIQPEYVDALYQRASIYCSLEQGAKAFEDCNKVIAADPQGKRFPEVFTFRAQADRQLELPDKIVPDCTKALSLGSSNKELLYNLRVYGYRNTGKVKEAIADLTTLLDKFKVGNADRLLRARSELFEQDKKPEKAAEDLYKALAINPRYDACYEQLARIHEHMGKPDKAVEDFSALIKINPDDEAMLLERGQLKMRMGRYSEALADINKCISIDPNLTSKMYVNRAEIYTKLGKPDLAAQDKAKAAKMLQRDL
ncbi:MAG: tetratricopeptide repeat protein [Cyanobacteria bacterium REEB67]|nr:tetratricopeptide repeat protein [Cyanobacteria bacterium REEB67]